MSRIALFIMLVFIGALALFASSNNETTTVSVPFGQIYEITKLSLILYSSISGAFAMLLVFIIRDAVRFVATFQMQKRQKKEDRLNRIYGQALNAILANELIEARRLLENILKEDPEHTDALLRMGDVAFKNEDYNDSIARYRRALTSAPNSFEAMFSLARVMETLKRWTEALGYIEDILDIDKDNLSALYKKRAILEKDGVEGKWEQLIDLQKVILKHELTEKEKQKELSAQLGYRYELARESLENSQAERAGKDFKAILRQDPKFLPAYLGAAEAMISSGEVDDAINSLEKAYEQIPSSIILARLEDILINQGDPSRIIKIYKKALSEDPQNNMLKFMLGKLYYRLEMIDDAFDILKSIDSTETLPEKHQLLGELYIRRQQYDRAVEEFRRTLGGKTLRIPYTCSVCGHADEDWSGRCPVCKSWNTYRFDIYGGCA